MSWPVLISTVAVIAVTAIYFLWVRRLPSEQPK
jgi:hypothetical protein